MHRLVEQNLVMEVHLSQEHLWIDQPPPRGIPSWAYLAWQTPLHREAVRRALREAASS